MSSAICLNLDQSKILLSGNGLRTVGNTDLDNFDFHRYMKVCNICIAEVQTIGAGFEPIRKDA